MNDPITGKPLAIESERLSKFHGGIAIKPSPYTTDIVFSTENKEVLKLNVIKGFDIIHYFQLQVFGKNEFLNLVFNLPSELLMFHTQIEYEDNEVNDFLFAYSMN